MWAESSQMNLKCFYLCIYALNPLVINDVILELLYQFIVSGLQQNVHFGLLH